MSGRNHSPSSSLAAHDELGRRADIAAGSSLPLTGEGKRELPSPSRKSNQPDCKDAVLRLSQTDRIN